MYFNDCKLYSFHVVGLLIYCRRPRYLCIGSTQASLGVSFTVSYWQVHYMLIHFAFYLTSMLWKSEFLFMLSIMVLKIWYLFFYFLSKLSGIFYPCCASTSLWHAWFPSHSRCCLQSCWSKYCTKVPFFFSRQVMLLWLQRHLGYFSFYQNWLQHCCAVVMSFF